MIDIGSDNSMPVAIIGFKFLIFVVFIRLNFLRLPSPELNSLLIVRLLLRPGVTLSFLPEATRYFVPAMFVI